MFSHCGSGKQKTFKPKKRHAEGTKLYQLHKYAKATVKATLGAGDLKAAVQLPQNEDLNEWLAVNSIEFVVRFLMMQPLISLTKSISSMAASLSFALHKPAPL
jgi:MOB kinase activator 1